MSKKRKYIAAFDYVDKLRFVLSAAHTGVWSIASFATAIGAPVGIASTSVSLVF